MEDPIGSFESVLKQMINAAKTLQMNRKLKRILKPEYRPITYIEIPNEKWYHSAEDDEIYEFDDGLFYAHTRQDCQELQYSNASIQKKLPSYALVIKVREEATGIIRLTENRQQVHDWTKGDRQKIKSATGPRMDKS